MEQRLIFMDKEHRAGYRDAILHIRKLDELTRLAVYLLTAAPEIREHFTDVYDTETGAIRHNCWLEPWVTPTARLLITAASSLTDRKEEFTLAVSESTVWPILLTAMNWRGRMMTRGKRTAGLRRLRFRRS